jgi:hypothetical protein
MKRNAGQEANPDIAQDTLINLTPCQLRRKTAFPYVLARFATQIGSAADINQLCRPTLKRHQFIPG